MKNMSEFNNINNNEFMMEKIKEMPVNRRKLMKRTLITGFLAVMFGLIACLTFLLLEPVISNWLYPEEEAEIVVFPEDEDEMKPEDMLEDEPEIVETPAPVQTPVSAQLDQDQVDEILDSVELDKSHYIQLYNVMNEYVKELSSYMVTVTVVEEDYDWLENRYEESKDTYGVVIARNNKDIFILTDETSLRTADKIQVEFYNGVVKEAVLTGKHKETDLAVLSISLEEMGTQEEIDAIPIPVLGSSKSQNIKGQPIVAMGSPMGKTDTVGYGMITTVSKEISYTDYNYDFLLTDIYGSQSGKGVLFNMQGNIIGVITTTNKSSDMRNMITAYGISELKAMISILTSGKQIPYLGIEGISVTAEAEADPELQIPHGAYVTNVISNSPAMMAGIQEGDIIIEINELVIEDYSDFEKVMYSVGSTETIGLKVMRFSQGTYKEMEMEAALKGAE